MTERSAPAIATMAGCPRLYCGVFVTLPVAVITLVLGFLVLAWSADRLVATASTLALHLGLAPLLVGLFVVGFGTSTPELLVSALAAMEGQPELALGNALGSNIANVGLILGLTLLFIPLGRHRERERVTLGLLVIATFGTLLLLGDLRLTRGEGIALLGLLVLAMPLIAWANRGNPDAAAAPERAAHPLPRTVLGLAGSLVLLLISARALIWAAVTLAEAAGVSQLVIGLSIVAVGTSLPELATAFAAARRQERALLYGNLIGSNLFNLLAVLGVTVVLHPLTVSLPVLLRDGVIMAALTVPLVLLARGAMGGARTLGATLLVAFALYQLGLFLFAQGAP